jgi:mono/diheme cytochrome c family protein
MMELTTCHRSQAIALLLLFTAVTFSNAQTEQKASSAEAFFKARCALCHGTDGTGKTTLGQQMKAANLRSGLVQKDSDALMKGVILHGKGNMPPFEGQLTEADVDQLVKYVRQFGKKK